MKNEDLKKGMELNKMKNIDLFIQLWELAEKLGFEYDSIDGMDGLEYITFKIEK